MKHRFIFFIAIFILLPVFLSGLTLEQGRMRLILHENNGRFSLYYLEDIEDDEYVSLLFERDPRTSSTGILLNNRVYTLGSSNNFSQKISKTSSGGKITWTSTQLTIQQSFSFVKSNPNGLADGVKIVTTVMNTSEEIQSVGIHKLFDTYLGEQRDSHFFTSDNEKLQGETGYSLQPPNYWVSPVRDDSEKFKGFISMLKGSGITLPDKVVFANWKRLSENLWNLQVQSKRNFNLLPYSINDSAVCQFYDPIKIAPGAERTVTSVIGAFTGSPISTGATTAANETEEDGSDFEDMLSSTRTGDIKALHEMVNEDLIAVNDIISQINSLLSFPEDITEEKIEVIERSLNNLSTKKNQYQNSE